MFLPVTSFYVIFVYDVYACIGGIGYLYVCLEYKARDENKVKTVLSSLHCKCKVWFQS